MDITPLVPADRQLINAYGDGGFRISGARVEGSVLIFPGRTLPWPIASMADIDAASLAPVLTAVGDVGLLLMGCGTTARPLPAALRSELRRAGIAVEVMDTGGACRTYNVLMAEDRRVAAALIAV